MTHAQKPDFISISRPTDATCNRLYFLSMCVLYMFQASRCTDPETSNQISSFGRTDKSISIGGGRQFSRQLAAEMCASAVVMLDTPCSEVVQMVLATHCIRQFPLHFPSRASPCAITFQLDSNSSGY
jgi:hypothetical protein